ncbi:tubulin polymerization-promoting protein family member 2-like isoform X2 [Mixophyes fleayi]
MSQELEKTFRKFASYGGSKSEHGMTGKNFSKLCKDCKIIESGCTSTDVDIVFTKVKNKESHVMSYDQFQKALQLLSVKRFPRMPADEAFADIKKLVEGKEPANTGATKAVAAGVVDRLTDTSKYTGSHKERFDDSGKGKGIAGRKQLSDNTGYVGAYKGQGSYDHKDKP